MPLPTAITDESWSFKPLARGTRWLTKLNLFRLVKSGGTYQPVVLNGRVLRNGDRSCAARWSIIEKVITETRSRSVLDLGCAEGYFVRHAVRSGRVALGVDGDLRSIAIAQSLNLLDKISGAAFMHALITPEFVERLPRFDVVIFLSVLHHIFTQRGPVEAKNMMRAVHAATGKRLIFDMGQSNESAYEWSARLPPMLPEPALWISQYLQDCGFSDVEVVGESEGYMQSHSRLLFIASP
jgi:SAM-dependent methyltransferase